MSLCFQFLESEQSDEEVDSNESIKMVADNCSIGDIMGMGEKKAKRFEACIKINMLGLEGNYIFNII